MDADGLMFSVSPPPPGTADTLAAIWMASGRGTGPFRADPVAPDGCVEVIVNLGDPFARASPGGVELQPRLLIVGQMTGPVHVGPTGRVDLIGLRVRTARVRACLGHEAWRLRDQMFAADALFGAAAADLADALACAASTAGRMEAITRLWSSCVAPSVAAPPLVDWTVSGLQRSGGTTPIEALATRAGTSRRHLERLFREHVGLTPKEYGRIVRVQRALARLARTPAGHGARIAAACGFADQAHMIRELRALAGLRPGALALDAFGPALSTAPAPAP